MYTTVGDHPVIPKKHIVNPTVKVESTSGISLYNYYLTQIEMQAIHLHNDCHVDNRSEKVNSNDTNLKGTSY